MKKYTYFNENLDKKFNINSMQKYLNEKQEIDKFLEKLIKPYIVTKRLKILDACCGIGHISYLLSKISPDSKFFGFDQTEYLINEAVEKSKNKNIQFEVKDILNLSKEFNKFFDITINWKTISWLPYYDDMMKKLFSVTKKHIFLSSLFYDGDIDFEIKVREYKKESTKKGHARFYNVYSYPHFKEFIYNLGAKNIEAFDFNIDIDLPKPPIDYMGTYTMDLKNGEKLQISGPVVMLWKIIRIDL